MNNRQTLAPGPVELFWALEASIGSSSTLFEHELLNRLVPISFSIDEACRQSRCE